MDNQKQTIIFGGKQRVPAVRLVQDMKEVILDKEWLQKNLEKPLYYMYRGLAENEGDAQKIQEANLCYDILDSAEIALNKEYNKTAGHYHSIVADTNITYPEIYELIKGEAYYLMQKAQGDKIIDIYAVKGEKGDKILIPPNYGHFTIFLTPVRQSNWISDKAVSDYEKIKAKQGAGYYALIDENNKVKWLKNKNYSYVPDLRFLSSANFEDLGLYKEKNMYELVENLDKLDYLNKPQDYLNLWQRLLK